MPTYDANYDLQENLSEEEQKARDVAEEQAVLNSLPDFVRKYEEAGHFGPGSGTGGFGDYIIYDTNMVIQGMKISDCLESAWAVVAREFFPVGKAIAYGDATPEEKKEAKRLTRLRGYIT